MKTGYCPNCNSFLSFGEMRSTTCPICDKVCQLSEATELPSQSWKPPLHGKKPQKNFHALTIRCPLPLYRELKKYSIRYNLSMQKTVERMLERGLKFRKDFNDES